WSRARSAWSDRALCARPAGYLPTNVVTVAAASVAVKLPPLTATAVLDARLSVAEVTHGVSDAGAVPPEIAIGTFTAAVPLVMSELGPCSAHHFTPDISVSQSGFLSVTSAGHGIATCVSYWCTPKMSTAAHAVASLNR